MAPKSESGDLYLFGCEAAGPRDATAEVVGNKAANLICMAKAGLPVPPGFVLPTALCRAYFEHGQKLPEDAAGSLRRGVREVEKATTSVGDDLRGSIPTRALRAGDVEWVVARDLGIPKSMVAGDQTPSSGALHLPRLDGPKSA